MILILLIILYLNINFILIKNKIIGLKVKNMELEVKDVSILISTVFLFNNIELTMLYCYFLFKAYDMVFSIYLRLILSKVYYKYIFDINSNQCFFVKTFLINYYLNKIIPKNEINYIVLSVLMIYINFNFWLAYWILYELSDMFGATMSTEYNQALFDSNQGFDIKILPKGFRKLKVYKKTLLDKKINISYELVKILPNFTENDVYFEHENQDFKYIDSKIEYLASIDCFYI